MARRLIEVGIPFVEVSLGGWDTHQDNFARVKTLSSNVDRPMSALIADLESRGLLDSTLVIWMGEFGRTRTSTPGVRSRAGITIRAGLVAGYVRRWRQGRRRSWGHRQGRRIGRGRQSDVHRLHGHCMRIDGDQPRQRKRNIDKASSSHRR